MNTSARFKSGSPCSVFFLLVAAMALPMIGKAQIIQTVNSTGATSEWNDAIWGSPAAVPTGGNTYQSAAGFFSASATDISPAVTGRVRAYGAANSASPVFAGSSLILATNTELLLKDTGETYSANLVLNGGVVRMSPNSGGSMTLAGSISVIASSYLGVAQASAGNILTVSSTLTGSNTLHLAGGQNINQTITFDDGAGTSLNGFAGTFDIGNSTGNWNSVIVDFNQAFVMTNASLKMGGYSSTDKLNLDANITIGSFSFTGSPVAAGVYTTTQLNSMVGNGSQFTGVGSLTVLSQATNSSQQIIITNGVQQYVSLTGMTVTMSNRCELWVTDASAPLSACTINLNSPDSYLVLPGIKPSVVVSAYLSQVKVSGAAAVADSNCRVVEYAMGAIILPHPSSLQPLTVYSGPNFTGSAMTLGQWTYYKSSLGAWYANISSFKLKRGYMAVVAQAENGMGVSKTYIAQDGDMEISVLPSTLDHNIRFIYVTPWRWISKKSIAGWPGNVIMPSVQSWYGWREIHSSTRDLEYTAMQWGLYLPNLDQYNWQSAQINTILGYNEPDHTDQSDMTVAEGIAGWPKLQSEGLRLGSPATAEGGDWWFSPFMSQANASNLRVDFVAIHDYACHDPTDPAGAAAQLYSYLKNYYDTYKRPIWLTEWNSGANWTSCGDPTAAQEQALIAAMIDMLDKTPWVERYCIYNWVEASRAVVDGSGNLTLAGTTYAAQQSPVGYVQALQDNGTRGFAEFRFENNTLDASGYWNNGIPAGSPAYTNGVHGQAIVFDGTNTVVTLPPNIATSSGFTFATWVKWGGGANSQRIFDFGNSMSEYMYLTPNSGSGLRFGIKDINLSEQSVQAPLALPANSWVHVAVTLNGSTARIYTNGVQAASASVTFTPADFNPRINTLGRCSTNTSPNTVPLFKGLMDDVFIADNALSATAIAQLVTNTPPQFTTNFIVGGPATEGVSYSSSLAGTATDADGQTVGYSKVTGPAWLSIASNGAMTGTPSANDGGTNYFTVTVTDSTGGGPGQHHYAVVQILVATTGNSNSAVWGADASTTWGTGSSWTNGDPPSGPGQTADFSTINITANRTVTLEASRSIGNLLFSDASGSQTWTLTNNGGSTLTLDSGSGALPTIAATNPVIISAPLAGTNGFIKSGPGTLTFSGNNLYLSGNLNVAQGAITVGNSYALGSGWLMMNGGAISNASGSYIAGNQINLASAGTFGIASGAKLTLTGIITNSGGLTKEGGGTLMLAGASTYTGTTVLNAGTLQINTDGSAPLGYSTLVINGGSLDNSVIRQYGLAYNNPQVWNGDFGFVGTQDLDLDGNVTVNGTRQVTVNANTFQLGGVISGSGGITKAGAGILYFSGSNNNVYSGGTTLSAGELQIADSQALGSGGLTINGGTLTARGASRTPANAVTVGGAFTLNGANGGANILTLSGTVNLGGSTRTVTVGASGGAAVSGIISNGGITKAGSGTTLTLSGANTFSGDTRIADGTLTLGNSLALQNSTLDMNVADAGSLSFGSRTAVTLGGMKGLRDLSLLNASSAAVALTVGGNGQSTTYSGALSGTGSSLTKTGTGTLTLSGANAFTGTTTVSSGTLLINGSAGAGAHTVTSGGILGGNGTISAAVTVQFGGTLMPGAGGADDTLAITGNLVLNSGSTNSFDVNGSTLAHETVSMGGSVIYGGVLKIATSGTFTNGQSFTLFTGAGATNVSNFSSIQGSPGPSLKFAFTNGVLNIVTASPSGPATLASSVSGSALALSWPAGQGWRLQQQTNSLSSGLGTNWVSVTDGSISSTNILLNPNMPTVFYRLVYP